MGSVTSKYEAVAEFWPQSASESVYFYLCVGIWAYLVCHDIQINGKQTVIQHIHCEIRVQILKLVHFPNQLLLALSSHLLIIAAFPRHHQLPNHGLYQGLFWKKFTTAYNSEAVQNIFWFF